MLAGCENKNHEISARGSMGESAKICTCENILLYGTTLVPFIGDA